MVHATVVGTTFCFEPNIPISFFLFSFFLFLSFVLFFSFFLFFWGGFRFSFLFWGPFSLFFFLGPFSFFGALRFVALTLW